MGLFGPSGPSLHGDAQLHTRISRNRLSNRPSPDKLADTIFAPNGCNGVLLGLDPKEDIGYCWWLNGARGHGLCFSSTGGGKNTNIIQPALLSYNGSALVLDPKAESAWICAERRRKFGRVVILDPWNKVNETYGSLVGVTEEISRFNPLSNLDPNSADFNDDVTLLADAIIIPSDRDPHWTESARELVAGLIAASVERAPGIASFRDVRRLLTAPLDEMADTIAKIVARNPHSLASRKLARFAPTPQKGGALGLSNEMSSIRSTAETQLAIFDAARLLDSMDTGPQAFDLADLARKRVTVFVVLPADKLLTHGRWMRLIIQLAMRAIARQPQPPSMPVLFLLDELGTINPGGGLKMIEQAYGLLGGMGIRIWGFFQNITQLQRDYPASWESFIGNSETIQLLRINERSTSEYFSGHIGNYTHQSRSGQSIVEQARPVILAQELRHLDPGECISLRSGKNGFRLFTRAYFNEPRFAGMYRPNPLYRVKAPAPLSRPPLTIPPELRSKTQELAEKATAWAKTDGADHAKKAAAAASEWAKTDGAEAARKTAAAASEGAAKASRWAGAKWAEFKARNGSLPPSDDPAE